MARRLSWWTIPAAMVVLVRVLMLGSPETDSTAGPERLAVGPRSAVAEKGRDLGKRAAAENSAASATVHPKDLPVVLQDAAGRRSGPTLLPLARGLVLQLPAAAAGQRVDFRLERHVEGSAAPISWLEGRPNIRAGAEMRISGLPAGRYAITIGYQDGQEACSVACHDFEVPGCVDLTR